MPRDLRERAIKRKAGTGAIAEKRSKVFRSPGGFKSLDATAEDMDKINRLAPKRLRSEEVVVREGWGAHNYVDRDNERFPDDLLADFALTLKGRPVLWPSATSGSHDWVRPGNARIFETWLEDGVLEWKGETIPVKWLRYKFYYLRSGNQQVTENFDGGIWFSNSIGFMATDLVPVYDGADELLYYEYTAPGEGLEMSIVGVEAQQGAHAKTAGEGAVDDLEDPAGGSKREGKRMRISIGGKQWDVDCPAEVESGFSGLTDHLKAMDEKVTEAEKTKTAITDVCGLVEAADLDHLKVRIEDLQKLAESGEKYRDDLITDVLKYAVLAGAVKNEDADGERKHLETLSMDRVKTERDRHKAVYEGKRGESPDAILEGNTDLDPQGGGAEGDGKARAEKVHKRIIEKRGKKRRGK